MNVLVTNAKSRIAYNIVKSLFIKGHNVYCADFTARAMSFYSRFSSGYFIYPSPFHDHEEFVECLISKIKELNIDVLIPVFEELFLVAKHKLRIEQFVKMVIPNYAQILIAHNKDQWGPIARQLDIPVPATWSFNELNNNPLLLAEIKHPVLIKPKQGGGGWGVQHVNTLEQLQNVLYAGTHINRPLDRFFVQQKIQGETICVAMVFSHGRFRGKTSYRQIREYPAFSGQATCRVSASNKLAEGYLKKLLEHLNWHGVCQVDFIIESETGQPYLIDINPRFWGSLAQGIASGVDFPHLICEIAVKGDVEVVDDFKEGVQTRWLGGELRGFFQHFTVADHKVSFLRDFFWPQNSTERFDDFSLNDPLPFAVWCWDSLYRVVKFRGNKPYESLDGVWE